MSTPYEMMAYGAKDALVKLNDTELVPADTAAYYDVESFHNTFPTSISYGERVLKQNRGSTGEGIWRVQIEDKSLEVTPGTALPLDTKLKCTEAVDNHTEVRELGEFMDFCDQYIIGDNGMLVDMRFMPRIVEGEIRILLVGRIQYSWSTRSQLKAAITSPLPCSPVRSTPTTSQRLGRAC